MNLRRGLLLIGVMLGVGMVRVAQQTSLTLAAYRLAEAQERCQDLENETTWMRSRVVALESPIHLAREMTERKLELVAWEEWRPVSAMTQVAGALDAANADTGD